MKSELYTSDVSSIVAQLEVINVDRCLAGNYVSVVVDHLPIFFLLRISLPVEVGNATLQFVALVEPVHAISFIHLDAQLIVIDVVAVFHHAITIFQGWDGLRHLEIEHLEQLMSSW